MSYEFVSTIHGSVTPAIFSKCVNALVLTGRYELEALSAIEARLRYAGKPRRDSWPEDLTISMEGEQVFVAIHVGAVGDRETCLRDLSDVFRANRIVLNLEEI